MIPDPSFQSRSGATRISRPGEEKSEGYRTIILFRRGERPCFVYGFSRSQRANINADEEKQLKQAASYVLTLTERQISVLVKKGDFAEVKAHEQEV